LDRRFAAGGRTTIAASLGARLRDCIGLEDIVLDFFWTGCSALAMMVGFVYLMFLSDKIGDVDSYLS
jgi:hypothetical protein